jgi:N-methylhydantoinase B
VFRHVSAGGGGCGDALTRSPALVLADVLDQKVGPVAARELYGVVIERGSVDETATAALRLQMRARARAG